MKITLADKSIAWLTLLSGLSISAVAVWYSVAGLISIFAAAAVPIAVMGIVLELSKLVATVWLKQNWFIAPRLIKSYLLIAIAILMLITSMGIFGYLSKAHLDQAVPTGDVAAKVLLIDEKIKTERDNIDAARRALQQMDAQVDARLNRSDDERGAERAVQIRKTQAKERASLQADIAKSQKAIAVLNQERAPIASELRKVEAEVGPIKYIAALLYGDNPDQNVLERAVRWVIILIVIIFDPLAVVLLLASQYSFQYFRRSKEEEDAVTDIVTTHSDLHVDRPVSTVEPVPEQQSNPNKDEIITHCPKCNTAIIEAPGIGPFCPNKDCDVVDNFYGDIDPETQAFFKRMKLIARLADIDEEQANIEEANRLIAEIPKEDEELVSVEMASDLAELTQVSEEDNSPYPFPMVRPLEGDAKLAQDLITSIPVLENEEMWAQRVVDESDEIEDSDAKRAWKLANPKDTIKRQRWLYEKGLIESLPWDTIEKFDEEKNSLSYEEDDGPLSEEQIEQIKQSVEYVQNSEQNKDSIWKKIKDKKDN